MCLGQAWPACLRGTRLRRCGCGTVLHDRSSGREEEERRYDGRQAQPERDQARVAACQWDWVKRLLKGDPVLPRVLDIGCGGGDFLQAAREDGCRVAGLEVDPSAVERCRGAGLPVYQGSIFEIGVPPGPWDVVTLWDVLDHLEDPRAALERVSEELAPGGLVVLRGRNTAFHAWAKAAYARLGPAAGLCRLPDLSVVHRWGFTAAGYIEILRQAGLTDISRHPAVPTPGDRHASLGPPLAGRALKGALCGVGTTLYQLSGRRWYPFPSVLVTARGRKR